MNAIAAIFCFLSAIGGAAANVSDPIADYLSRSNPNAYADNTTRKDSYCSDFKLFRVELDLNNDGQREVLISSSNNRNGKQGNDWTVYEPIANGFIIAGGMTFRPGGFYLGPIDEIHESGLVTFGPGGGGEGILSAWLFDGQSTREVQITAVTRAPATGDLIGEAILEKYMRKATIGDDVVETIDADTLARKYGIQVKPQTYREEAEALLAQQQARRLPHEAPSITPPSSAAEVLSEDPIQDYLRLPDPDLALELPSFKGISVLDLDIDGDGRIETLIAADGYGGRLGNLWTVYVPQSNGFRRLTAPSKDVVFRVDMFYVGVVETNDRKGIRGLVAYFPGKGGGDLAVYQLANGYMIKTDLPSLNFQNENDRAFWEKYFAGPSEEKPHRSRLDHPTRHWTLKELSERGYDISAVTELNSSRLKQPK